MTLIKSRRELTPSAGLNDPSSNLPIYKTGVPVLDPRLQKSGLAQNFVFTRQPRGRPVFVIFTVV